jgi:hypothetical protein
MHICILTSCVLLPYSFLSFDLYEHGMIMHNMYLFVLPNILCYNYNKITHAIPRIKRLINNEIYLYEKKI